MQSYLKGSISVARTPEPMKYLLHCPNLPAIKLLQCDQRSDLTIALCCDFQHHLAIACTCYLLISTLVSVMIGWMLEAFPGWLKCVERNKAPVRLPVQQYALGDLILVIVYKASIVVSADCTLLFKIYCSFYRSILKGPYPYCTWPVHVM